MTSGSEACRRCGGPLPRYCGVGRRRLYCSKGCSDAMVNANQRRAELLGPNPDAFDAALTRLRAQLERVRATAYELQARAERASVVSASVTDTPRLRNCAAEFRRIRRALGSVAEGRPRRRARSAAGLPA